MKFQRPIELGGGMNPRFHPNLDVRAGEGVDIVFDFDALDGILHLPIKDGSHDFVFCQYAIEHISWRKVDLFIREIYRILDTDGVAQIITANTFEQCKMIVERGYWIQNDSCMLFGDQNYGENSHKCGWSSDYIGALFKSVGFNRIYTGEIPGCKTDLLLIAEKGDARAVVTT